MAEIDFSLLAKKLLSGEWEYSSEESSLTKFLGDSIELKELHVLDNEGLLDENFKSALYNFLGANITKKVTGPFGDDDLFYGTDYDDVTSYYLQMYQVNQAVIDELQKLGDIDISTIE